ncbi:amidohydrolase family protein [Marinomonas spartinae]|uniref:amidohydrolase family protein n=1 Tax=Marinomonas spartinae TaxID=1792290 RepID=UPI0018F1B77C|nr:amidohydrolase family protein [Marinomonas spartinae]MBJ7556527.1 amidohydrolase family protein [Marinomonas spartinae]
MKHNHTTHISCSCCNPLWKSFLPEDFSHNVNTKDTFQLSVSPQDHNIAQIIRVERYSELAEKASGTIITMKDGQNEKVEAIGMVGEKILATGNYEDVQNAIKESQASETIERVLTGSETLIPGMIDPHIHIVSTAVMNICTDVGPFDGQYLRKGYNRTFVIQTLAELADSIEATMKDEDVEQHWVLGRNVDPSLFSGKDREFNADTLDEISTKLPVYIMNSSGHLAYINSVAIKLLREAKVPLPENDMAF